MAGVAELQSQFTERLSSLYREEWLDHRFKNILWLSEWRPNHLAGLVALFFEETQGMLDNLATVLERRPADLAGARTWHEMLNDASAIFGAMRMSTLVAILRDCIEAADSASCLQCSEDIRSHCSELKNKLDPLSSLFQQIIEAGGSIPEVD